MNYKVKNYTQPVIRKLDNGEQYILENDITVCLKEGNYGYIVRINIKAGAVWDGLSVPYIFRWFMPNYFIDNPLANVAGSDTNHKNALTVDSNGDVTVYDNDLSANISVSSYLKPKTYFNIHTELDANSIRQTWSAAWRGPDNRFGVVTANAVFEESGYYQIASHISIKGGENWKNSPVIAHYDWSATSAEPTKSLSTTGYNSTYVSEFANYYHNNTIFIPTAGSYTLYQPIITNNWTLPTTGTKNYWLVNINVSRG